MKRIILLSHCLFNQEVRAKGFERDEKLVKRIFEIISKANLPVFQMPCPEFTFLGEREKMTYDEYEKLSKFREHCKELAEDVSNFIKKWNGEPIIVGIAGSPSCSLSRVKVGNEKKKGTGIFMQELKRRIKGKYIEIDYDFPEESLRKFSKVIFL